MCNKKGFRKPHEKGIFVRLGPVNGQYQTHRGNREAPSKRGIWALPIQFSYELSFLGGWNGRLDRTKEEEQLVNDVFTDNISFTNFLDKYKDVIKGLDINLYRHKEYWLGCSDRSAYGFCLDNKIHSRKFKRHYKRINLKMTDELWCHLPPIKDVGHDWWYKVSVREYWHRAQKYMTENWAPELYEVFIEM